MFKKLFGRKDTPKKNGTEGLSGKLEGPGWTKGHSLELSNMEGKPTYELTSQLVVGSEVGDIIISDPSISPRHCTFTLQDGVISLMDHASVTGTLVNEKKIPSGRNIILEETDVILVGDLEVRIIAKSIPNSKEELVEKTAEVSLRESAPESDSGPSPQLEKKQEVKEKESFFKRFFRRKTPVADEGKKPTKNALLENLKKNKNSKNKKTASVAISGHSSTATNSLLRVFAIGLDLLLAYAMLVIVAPFDEFRTFVSDLPGLLNDLFQLDLAGLWMELNDDYPILKEISVELKSLFSSMPNLGPFLFLFVSLRFFTTLMMGVTLSEGALGIRAHGNMVWKRLGGGIRVLLGVVTGPLIIFDLPAVFSRRTFKEFMTFTHIYTASKFLAILGILLYLPLVLALVLLSPLFQGFEVPEAIYINDKPDRRVKLAPKPGETVASKRREQTQFFGFQIDYDPASVRFVPLFKFSGEKKKITYKTSLGIFDRELKRNVQIELLKSFDLREFLGLGISGNFLLYEKFPEMYNFVYSSDSSSSAFKSKNNEKTNRKFADEVASFSKLCLSLNAENAIEYMELYSPWLKGMMDYRLALMDLIEYKNFDQADFVKIGNAQFLRFSYVKQKPFDILIPLIKGQGRVFKIDYDKREGVHNISSKLYKFVLDGTDWFPGLQAVDSQETLNPFQVLDDFSRLKIKDDIMTETKAQALYGYYFEQTAAVLKQAEAPEIDLWKKSLESIFMIVQKMKETMLKKTPPPPAATTAKAPAPEAASDTAPEAAPVGEEVPQAETGQVEQAPAEDPRLKLFQKFAELKEAFEAKNNNFFQLDEATSTETTE